MDDSTLIDGLIHDVIDVAKTYSEGSDLMFTTAVTWPLRKAVAHSPGLNKVLVDFCWDGETFRGGNLNKEERRAFIKRLILFARTRQSPTVEFVTSLPPPLIPNDAPEIDAWQQAVNLFRQCVRERLQRIPARLREPELNAVFRDALVMVGFGLLPLDASTSAHIDFIVPLQYRTCYG